MNRIKSGIARLSMVSLLVGLSMVIMSSALSFAAKIGESYSGGIVFFVDSTGQHGLIAAREDIDLSYIDAYGAGEVVGAYRWSTGQYRDAVRPDYAEKMLSNTSPAIGEGAENTRKILAKYPVALFPQSASAVASMYRGGGYSDWFLPSKEELNQLYLNRGAVEGLVPNFYWSSTEDSADHAWFQCFSNGKQFATNKTHVNLVRPVRAF